MNDSIRIIRVPFDSGHESWRMGKGPVALTGDQMLAEGPGVSEVRDVRLSPGIRYEMEATLELHRLVAAEVAESHESGETPVIFSGNCNVPAVAVAAASEGPLGSVWFDAHGDFNTAETSPSGFIDGMALSAVTGSVWQAALSSVPGFSAMDSRNVVLVGARDLDPEEERRLRESDIRWIVPDDLDSLGSALDDLARSVDRIYLHLDLDVLDPGELTSNQYAAPAGLKVGQLLEALSEIDRRFEIVGVGIAAYDPASDEANRGPSIVKSILDRLFGHRS